MASDTKFTPGPWCWGGMYGHESVRIEAKGGRVVGTVRDSERRGLDKNGMYIYEQTEEGRANARLIAAAPDLYAVVDELEESSSYWSEYCVPIGIVDRLRAALAKARGEA